MKTLTIFLLLPLLTSASIQVDIMASEEASERQVHISGSDVSTISDEEIETFQLYEGNLKEAINKYLGTTPDSVYLKSPTPWNDLYKTFGWQQVTRILKPIRAKMFSVKFAPELVIRQFFNNTSSKPVTYKAHVFQKVEDTIASIWETRGELYAGLNISYGFDIKAMAVSGKATMSYTSRWGQNVMKSQTVTVGSEVGLEIILQPNQRAVAELFATRGEMSVQIDYEASLGGNLAVNFENGYKDHHFWGLDVNKVLMAGGMNRTVWSSENITLNYFADSEVTVRDFDTNDILNYQ